MRLFVVWRVWSRLGPLRRNCSSCSALRPPCSQRGRGAQEHAVRVQTAGDQEVFKRRRAKVGKLAETGRCRRKVGRQPSTPSRRWHFSGRAAAPLRKLPFANQVEKSMPRDFGRSPLVRPGQHGRADERLLLQAANWRCRPIAARGDILGDGSVHLETGHSSTRRKNLNQTRELPPRRDLASSIMAHEHGNQAPRRHAASPT